MGIKITSKVPGFRRAGVAHEGTQVYPSGRFTAAQVAALKAEKNLVVEDQGDALDPNPVNPESETETLAASGEPSEAPAPAGVGEVQDPPAPGGKGKK